MEGESLSWGGTCPGNSQCSPDSRGRGGLASFPRAPALVPRPAPNSEDAGVRMDTREKPDTGKGKIRARSGVFTSEAEAAGPSPGPLEGGLKIR